MSHHSDQMHSNKTCWIYGKSHGKSIPPQIKKSTAHVWSMSLWLNPYRFLNGVTSDFAATVNWAGLLCNQCRIQSGIQKLLVKSTITRITRWCSQSLANIRWILWSFVGISIWLVVQLPSWNMMEFVNGKDYPIYYGASKMFETTNQSIVNEWAGFINHQT